MRIKLTYKIVVLTKLGPHKAFQNALINSMTTLTFPYSLPPHTISLAFSVQSFPTERHRDIMKRA